MLEGQINPMDFRFLWRSAIVAVGFDDNGIRTTQTFNSVEQLSISFLQVGDVLFLRLTDPPRATRELFNALELAGGIGMSIQPYIFSPRQQARMLNHCDDFSLIGLRGVGISSRHHVVARIELASKDGINIKLLPFLDELKFNPDQSSYEVMQEGIKGQVTFTVSGAVRITGGVLPFVVSQLENQLGTDH